MVGVEAAAGRRMVVGVDGSPGSSAALAWAAARTGSFGPVQPVAAWQYPWWSLSPLAPGAAALPPPSVDFHREARQVVDQMLAQLGSVDHLEPVTAHGPAGQVLVGLADGATLMVVGTGGHGAVAAGLLGSVSLYCVNHATVPVAVIPSDAVVPSETVAPAHWRRIVVGFDGSPHAVAALDWAVDHAPPEAVVEVVHSHRLGDTIHADPALGPPPGPRWTGPALVEAAVARARRRSGAGDGMVQGRCQDGDPRLLLRSASEEADLLVVGARGHQGVAHLLLGSVATGLVHHPRAPTVVVP